jgi:hypothetical protein
MRKKMPIEIIIPAWKSQKHLHRCPLCRRVKEEPNDLCRKESGNHTYLCITCAQDYKRRFGSFADDVLDVFMGPQQRGMISDVAPDKISDELDQRDEERKIADARRSGESSRETVSHLLNPVPATITAAEQKEEFERAMDEAEKITWEEAAEEIKKIEKEEF